MSEELQKIKVTISPAVFASPLGNSKIEVELNSNSTVFDLEKEIAKKFLTQKIVKALC